MHRALLPFLVLLASITHAFAGITLLGTFAFSGEAVDKSRLSSSAGGPDSTPQDRFGGFGSAIASLGHDDLYVAATDRGPNDGESNYRCRVHTLRIRVQPEGTNAVDAELLDTTLLSARDGRPFVGNSRAFTPTDQPGSPRLDPEGIRVLPDGSYLISDEYGPFIDVFSPSGALRRRFLPPAKFMIEHPSSDGAMELPPHNLSGRQSNHGFEGLALAPDASRAWAILQAPLIQDGALDASNKRIGRNCRVLELDLASSRTRELVYPLESPRNGVNEALALSADAFLILERDSKTGEAAAFRRLYRCSLTGASDVSSIPALPSGELAAGVTPLKKTLFLDFCDPTFGLAGKDMPEKIEGLCFGPTLADGRRTLIVTIDNDLKADAPSWIWVFALSPDMLR